MPFFVKKGYTIKEAQRQLAAVVRTAERSTLATITRHDEPVASDSCHGPAGLTRCCRA